MGYQQITLTTDAAGAATGRTDQYVEGEILQIAVDYTGAAVGTNLVIDQTLPPIPILTILANNVDNIWSPRAAVVDPANVALFYAAVAAPAEQVVDRIYVCGPITATVAAGGAGAQIVVTIIYKDHPSD